MHRLSCVDATNANVPLRLPLNSIVNCETVKRDEYYKFLFTHHNDDRLRLVGLYAIRDKPKESVGVNGYKIHFETTATALCATPLIFHLTTWSIEIDGSNDRRVERDSEFSKLRSKTVNDRTTPRRLPGLEWKTKHKSMFFKSTVHISLIHTSFWESEEDKELYLQLQCQNAFFVENPPVYLVSLSYFQFTMSRNV